MPTQTAEIFASGIPTGEKIARLREAGDEGHVRSLLRTYVDSPMPEPVLSHVGKQEGQDVYLFRKEGTSQGFLVDPGDGSVKGPLPLGELESLGIWEPVDDEEAEDALSTTLDL